MHRRLLSGKLSPPPPRLAPCPPSLPSPPRLRLSPPWPAPQRGVYECSGRACTSRPSERASCPFSHCRHRGGVWLNIGEGAPSHLRYLAPTSPILAPFDLPHPFKSMRLWWFGERASTARAVSRRSTQETGAPCIGRRHSWRVRIRSSVAHGGYGESGVKDILPSTHDQQTQSCMSSEQELTKLCS